MTVDAVIGLQVYLYGILLGSFYNVCISRLPIGEAITGRSRCPKCRTWLKWYDNIPILSYALLQGKCRTCKLPISSIYPTVELLTGCTFFAGFYASRLNGGGVLDIAVNLMIISIAVIGFGIAGETDHYTL
jgi:leader peptidase (prepilin peptidase)/N-methyltransferase